MSMFTSKKIVDDHMIQVVPSWEITVKGVVA